MHRKLVGIILLAVQCLEFHDIQATHSFQRPTTKQPQPDCLWLLSILWHCLRTCCCYVLHCPIQPVISCPSLLHECRKLMDHCHGISCCISSLPHLQQQSSKLSEKDTGFPARGQLVCVYHPFQARQCSFIRSSRNMSWVWLQ